jgi:hypothetical protein
MELGGVLKARAAKSAAQSWNTEAVASAPPRSHHLFTHLPLATTGVNLHILGETEDGVVEGNSQTLDGAFGDTTVAAADVDNGWKSKRRKAEERMRTTGGSLEDDEIEEF